LRRFPPPINADEVFGTHRYRYLALAVLLNVPGNAVIGGGGGIAMLVGMTRLFSFPAYIATVVLAVSPVCAEN